MKRAIILAATLLACQAPVSTHHIGAAKTVSCVGLAHHVECRVELTTGGNVSVYDLVVPGDEICRIDYGAAGTQVAPCK